MLANIFTGLICLTSLSLACNYSTCDLLSQLECALYTTDSNERNLNRAFFPPRKATSRYITVKYRFREDDDSTSDDSSNCTVSYIWAIGGFLLIQPPTIFQMTSLLFSYPANDIENMNLTFPVECRKVINDTGDECSCNHKENQNLDILSQQVRILL